MKIVDSWFKHLLEIVEEENKTKDFLDLIKSKYPNMSDDEISYLTKKGTKLGWCYYNPKEEKNACVVR